MRSSLLLCLAAWFCSLSTLSWGQGNMVVIQGQIHPKRAEIGGGQWNIHVKIIAYYSDSRTGRQVTNKLGERNLVAGTDGSFTFQYPAVQEYPMSYIDITIIGGWWYHDDNMRFSANRPGDQTHVFTMRRKM